MKTIRYGIIGAGTIARSVGRVFTEGSGSVAGAVADVDEAAARALAATVEAPRWMTDYHQLLADPEIDAVYIATPPFLHRPMVVDALRAGKHVVCEKPFTLSRREVVEIMTVAATRPDLKVSCCSGRYQDSGMARRARAIIEAGELGEVYRLHYEHVTGGYRIGTKFAPWRNDPKLNGGGISFDWGVYDLDWMLFVLGERFRPRTLFATLDNYFPLTAERIPPCLDVDGRLAVEMVCEGGLTVHYERRNGEHGPARQRMEIRGRQAGLDLVAIPMGDDLVLRRHAYHGADELRTEVLPDQPAVWDDLIVFPIRDLTESILADREPASPPCMQLTIHGVLDALLESAARETSVPVVTTAR